MRSKPRRSKLHFNAVSERLRLASVVLLGVGLVPLAPGADNVNTKLKTFQNFVNGRVPVSEAVMYRRISKPDGKVLNQEWWRFSWQDNTWYVQRLQPDGADPSRFVPEGNGDICGKSWTHAWTISDKNVHVAEKALESGSKPDTFCAYPRSLLFCALSLGLPRRVDGATIEDAAIEWDGLEFRSTVATSRDPKGTVLATSSLAGKLTLTDAGVPASADYPGVGQFPGGFVAYEYRMDNGDVPAVFTIKNHDKEYRYEFVSLKIGSNDLSQTEGYVPSLLADLKLDRNITLWTNDQPYSVIKGRLQPAFGVHEHQKRNALFIMISLAVGAAIILAFWYRRSG